MSPAGWSRSSHDGSRVAARQLCFGGEEFFAFGDEASLLGGGQGEGGAGLWREFCEGEVVGGSELLLPVGWAEDAPALDGYPEDASDVGGGEDAFGFEELVEALGAGGELFCSSLIQANILPPMALSPTQKTSPPNCSVSTAWGRVRRKARMRSTSMTQYRWDSRWRLLLIMWRCLRRISESPGRERPRRN
jgi:hypothetical protein